MSFLTDTERKELKEQHGSKAGTDYQYLTDVANMRRNQAAKALGVATLTGISAEQAYSMPDLQIENLITPQDFQKLGMDYPEVKRFLEDPIHMAIVRDRRNIKSLTDLEDTSSLGTAVLNTLKSTAQGFAGFAEAQEAQLQQTANANRDHLRGMIPDEAMEGMEQSGQASIDNWKNIRKSELLQHIENRAPEDKWVKQLAIDFVESAGPNIAAILATMVTKNPSSGALFMGSQIQGSSYTDLVDEGVSHDRAFTGASLNAGAQALLEYAPLKWLFRPAKGAGAKAYASKILNQMGIEGLTEALQQFPEEATNIWAKYQDKSWSEYGQLFMDDIDGIMRRAGYAGVLGTMFGAVSGTGSVIFARNMHKAQMRTLEQAAGNLQKSPLIQESPEVLEAFRNQSGEKVYIDAENLMQYYQSGDTTIMEDLHLEPDQVAEAASKGEMIEVPKGTYEVMAARHPEAHQTLKNDIAFDENALTANRIELQNDKDIKKTKEAIAKQSEDLRVETDRITNELRQAGVPSQAAVDWTAQLVAFAETSSSDPAAWLRENSPIFKQMLDDSAMYNQVVQAIGSAGTSLRQIPASFKKVKWQAGTRNIDIGGGKFDLGTEYLKNSGVTNLVYDPYNRSAEHNASVVNSLANELTDTATITNVLNVVAEKAVREDIARQAAKAIKDNGTAYFQIYEGNKSGIGKVSKNKDGVPESWQNNLPTRAYADEVGKWFGNVKLRGNIIEASQPVKDASASIWENSDGTVFFQKNKVKDEFPDKRYFQAAAMRATINLDEQVNVVDISGDTRFDGLDKKQIVDEITKLAKEKGPVKTTDPNFMLNLPESKTGANHIIRNNSYFRNNDNQKITHNILENMETVFASAPLIEIEPNTKQNKQTISAAYVRFFLPVRIDGRLETVAIDTELRTNGEFKVQSVNLYEIHKREKHLPQTEFQEAVPHSKIGGLDLSPAHADDVSLTTLSIREMLSGVKDRQDNYYIDPATGMPTWDTGFWQDKNKGAIGWNSEGRAVISFFSGADLSTLIHEASGHFFSQVTIDMGNRTDAPGWIVRNGDTLLEQVGLDRAKWNEHQSLTKQATREEWNMTNEQLLAEGDRSEIRKAIHEVRRAHETWANWAETYMLEGRAPSAKLRGTFARFKKWLTEVYKDIKRSEYAIPLTDEVRQVFDRMLATEAEINQMQMIEGYYNKLPQVALEDLTPAQMERLDQLAIRARQKAEDLLSGQVLKVYTEETKEAMRKERERVYEDSLQELSSQQVYKAIAQIEREFEGQFKDAWNLARAYQQKEQSYFSGAEYKGKLTDDMSVHFDFLAELGGYSSGSEMAAKILAVQPMSLAASQMADGYIKTNYDAVADNKELFDRMAREAVYNEHGAELVATELQIIGEKAGQFAATNEQARYARMLREQTKAAAAENISNLTIDKATHLQSWIVAERRSAEKAAVALAKGDFDTALMEKKVQLYNHAMVQESLKVRRRFESAKKYLSKQRTVNRDTWDKESNFVQAADVLSRFGFVRRDYDPVSKTESLASYIARQETENPDIISIAEWLERDVSYSKPRENLTIDEYEDIANAVRNIKQLDRIGANSDAFAVIDGGGSSSQRAMHLMHASEDVKDVQSDVSGAERARSSIAKGLHEFWMGNKKITQILLELDNMKDFGPWHRTFYGYVKSAADNKSDMQRRVSKKINDAFAKAGITAEQKYKDSNNKMYIPEWDASLSKMDLRVIALNMGSASNMERLLSQPPVGFDPLMQNWNEETIKNVLGKYLAKEDFNLVEDIWQAINLYPEYNQMVTKMTGFSMPKVEALPIDFTLADGENIVLSGGYYPLKQDIRQSVQAEMYAEQALGDYVGVLPYPNTGATKKRTKVAYSVDLDISNLFNHIEQITHDIAFRPVMHDLNKLMRKPEIKETLRRKLSDDGYTAVREWQKAVGRGKDVSPAKGWMNGIINPMRSRTIVASLLFRPGVIVQNNANFSLYGNSVEGFTEMDAIAAYTKRGIGDYIPAAMTNSERAKELREFVYARSVMMQDKLDAPDYSLREMQGMVKEGNILSRNFEGALQDIGIKIEMTQSQVVKFGGDILAWSDQLTDIPMWLGAYEKALEMGKSEKDAAYFADTVIERSTGSGRLIDTSGLQRGSAVERLLTMFTGFFNTQLNRWMREYGIQRQKIDVGRLFMFMAKQYVGFGVLSALYSFKWPEEDKFAEWFIKEIALWPLAMVPFLGSATKTAIEEMSGFQSFGWSMSPVESQVKSGNRAVKQVKKYIMGEAEGADAAEAVAAFSSFLFKYPDQLNDWFFNAYDYLENGMKPEFIDTVKRRPRRER